MTNIAYLTSNRWALKPQKLVSDFTKNKLHPGKREKILLMLLPRVLQDRKKYMRSILNVYYAEKSSSDASEAVGASSARFCISGKSN